MFIGQGLVWHLHAGGQVISTTAEHPFYVRDRGWTPCNQLQVGDWLVTLDGWCGDHFKEPRAGSSGKAARSLPFAPPSSKFNPDP